MPRINESNEPALSLEIAGADIDGMEGRIPLPLAEYKTKSGIIAAHQNFDFAFYTDGNRQWIDYAGAGRILLDYGKGTALSLIHGDAMPSTYQKYLFCDHPLGKLFTSMGIFSMHASCASVNGKGIAFTGISGAGKSTAAFALMQKGMPILTDEKLFILKKDSGYSAWSVSDIIKVRYDAISRFFSAPDSCLEYDVIAGEHYLKLGDSKKSLWQNTAPLKVLCLLEQTGKPETQVIAVNPTKLVGGLFPVTITSVPSRHKAAIFELIMDMLENVECRLVRFGTDMDDFAAKIQELAETL
jgi:hypothetical protein